MALLEKAGEQSVETGTQRQTFLLADLTMIEWVAIREGRLNCAHGGRVMMNSLSPLLHRTISMHLCCGPYDAVLHARERHPQPRPIEASIVQLLGLRERRGDTAGAGSSSLRGLTYPGCGALMRTSSRENQFAPTTEIFSTAACIRSVALLDCGRARH